IKCINSPEWSDFHLDMLSFPRFCINPPEWPVMYLDALPKFKTIVESMLIYKCDLPTNNSLGEITQTLGITRVKKLVFQSYKNLSFALVKHHLDDLKNLKSLSLPNNNLSYADKDLLAGLVNLTDLNLRDNNLHQVTGFFNYTPGLQFLELGDNALQSIEPGTFDNLKNLLILKLS
ncbi:platelet glycoprotein V-like, partial [Temnothorax curvispinosus]|uniref:Platelet glycoprotein V-like n=1 Tax=Temnothorax curvispinosus TaxID=300111 RepID=A0A6J1PXH9_9HYME